MTERFNVIGCRINASSMTKAVDDAVQRARSGKAGYICFVNVHVAVMASRSPELLRVINSSFMSLPDGSPVYWVGRAQGLREVEQVPGPDFFTALLSVRADPPLRHYFYGGKPEVLDTLVDRLKRKYPVADIVGAESPPFRELTDEESQIALERIRRSRPDFVWVGLGAPKQEMWMARNWEQLGDSVLFGVGAAFDFHAKVIKRAPRWMQRMGLEWVHRLSQEPGRLWKRYVYTNAMFCWAIAKQAAGFRFQRLR